MGLRAMHHGRGCHACLRVARHPRLRQRAQPVHAELGTHAATTRADSSTIDAGGSEGRKEQLFSLLGAPSVGDPDYRGRVAEAQVALETQATGSIDFERLRGLWRLRYTTAPDVVALFESASQSSSEQRRQPSFLPVPLPQPRCSAIYQRFTGLEEGVLQNIITLGDGWLLQRDAGAAVVVNTAFRSRGPRTLSLRFCSAQLSGLQVTDAVEAALAPALLPRSWLQHRLLLAIREFKLVVPFEGRGSGDARARGGEYMLTYLDDDTLIGRAQQGGGSFIFSRADLSEIDSIL